MQDHHVATIKFLNPLLKIKQLQLAKAAHTPEFATLNAEFENLRKRLCLEIEYAMAADNDREHGF
ncbi:hypothetical protein [Chthoniobacter flavus]|uniref:hypothetical protein n=1 Tax=Chthoniobacter flavus TaxID=191863 RepID=UPI00030B3E64|nr:hypothetical protein [Chthoniobacter flavus]